MSTRLTIGLALACGLIALLLLTLPKPEQTPIVEEPKPSAPISSPAPIKRQTEKTHTPLSITDPRLLSDYGTAESSPIEDLERVDNVLQRFWLLYKDPDQLRVGSNEDIMKTLTGSNPDDIAFISPDNAFIDSSGRLLDRWGTPLFFHAQSLTDIEIRSAGPDKALFTDDDIQTASQSSIQPR